MKKLTSKSRWTAWVLCLASAVSSSVSMAAEKLYLFNWNDYLAEETLKRFEAECACEVHQDYYSATEEMLAKLQAGASGYDVVIPTQNAVETLIKQKFLAPLDKSKLPNIKNAAAAYLDRSYDKGNVYSVPYAFTTTLIGYNETEISKLGIDANDWSILFDPVVLEKIKGKVTAMDDSDELFGAALIYLGFSPNDTVPEHLKQAQAVISKAKPYWAAFNSSSYIKELTVGNIWVAHGYSSDMFQARADALEAKRAFTVNFALPKQGAILALDNMVIPKDAKNVALAHRFINFMMDPKNAADLTNMMGTGNPNAAAITHIKPEIQQIKAIFPDQTLQAKLQTLGSRDVKSRRVLNKLWTEVKLK
jgi:spermidine/putrescine transport system substrate-binding protein